jgi:hypothetical protein
MTDQVLPVGYHFGATDRATTVHFQGALLLVDCVAVVTTILPGRRAFYADARTACSGAARIIKAKAAKSIGYKYVHSFSKYLGVSHPEVQLHLFVHGRHSTPIEGARESADHKPSHASAITARGSSATSQVVSRIIVGRRWLS